MKRFYELKNNTTGGDMPDFKTTVEVTMTDTDLIFEFDCKNSKFFSASDKYNGPLFNGDVCEAFICTDGSRKFYYEIEVAPNNVVFLYKMENLGIGITLSALYILFSTVSTTFSVSGVMSPFMSVWLPNFIFLTIGIFLYIRVSR